MLKKITKNTKGFTLIELLVAIAIMGIITIMALPSISKIQNDNMKKKYEKYGESLLTSAKLYTDAYTIDMFGNNNSGCYQIPYKALKDKGLAKDIKINGAKCDDGGTGRTYVRVQKVNDNYRYDESIVCNDRNGTEVYKKLLSETCTEGPDEEGPKITFTPTGKNNYAKSHTVTVNLTDSSGFLENIQFKYGWTTAPNKAPSTFKTKSFNNKRDINKTTLSTTITTPANVSGDYYLVIEPTRVIDAIGNATTVKKTSNAFKLDNTEPSVPSATVRYDSSTGTVRGNSSAWTNRTLWWGSYNATDSHAGVDHYEYSTNCTGNKSGNLNASGHTYSSTTNYTFCIRAVDKVGNTGSWSSAYYFKIDKTAPGVPSATVRYDSKSGTVRGNSSAWTNKTLWWGSYNASDTGGSNINHYEYSTNCTGSKSGNLDATNGHTYSSTTNYTFCIRAVDNAGNIGGWSGKYYFKVDKNKPTCTSSGGSGAWTNGNRTLTGTCSDTGGSGCQGNASQAFTSNTNTTTASPGTVYDNAGNATACPDNQTVKIDKSKPYTPIIQWDLVSTIDGKNIQTGKYGDCVGSNCGGSNFSLQLQSQGKACFVNRSCNGSSTSKITTTRSCAYQKKLACGEPWIASDTGDVGGSGVNRLTINNVDKLCRFSWEGGRYHVVWGWVFYAIDNAGNKSEPLYFWELMNDVYTEDLTNRFEIVNGTWELKPGRSCPTQWPLV